jgi:hypothetical protein
MRPKRALLLRRERLIKQLPPLTEVIRGSLIERRLQCGKPHCHCAEGEGHHAWYLTVTFAGGRTEQVTVPEIWVPTVRGWLKNYERWWEILEEVSGVNRELLRKRWLAERMGERRRDVRKKGPTR